MSSHVCACALTTEPCVVHHKIWYRDVTGPDPWVSVCRSIGAKGPLGQGTVHYMTWEVQQSSGVFILNIHTVNQLNFAAVKFRSLPVQALFRLILRIWSKREIREIKSHTKFC